MDTKGNNSGDKPRKINSAEANFTSLSSKIKAQEKISDKETIYQQNGIIQQEFASKINGDNDNEINDDDNRDHGDSTKDWDAENNNSGRHK